MNKREEEAQAPVKYLGRSPRPSGTTAAAGGRAPRPAPAHGLSWAVASVAGDRAAAAAASPPAPSGPQPPPRPLVRGAVTVAADKFLAPLLGAVGVPMRSAARAGRGIGGRSVARERHVAGVVDANGFGVVAKQPLRADQIIIDPTVLLVPRPSDYARPPAALRLHRLRRERLRAVA